MNALSLLVCWTVLGQVGVPLGSNPATAFGAKPNSNPSGGVVSTGSGFSATQAPPMPLGSSSSRGSSTNFNDTGFNNDAALGSALDQTSEADGKNYGWQINKYGELEYLIQISPSMLGDMQNPVNRSELESRIPKELVGRIKRVVVSIGNEILPRSPSLIEVERMVPVTASLPPGRIQNLEGGSVVNVNNTADNGFQTFNQPQSNNPNLAATAPLGTMAEQNRSNQGIPAYNGSQGSLLDRLQSSGSGISGGRLGAGSSASGRLGTSTGNFSNNQNYPLTNGGYASSLDPNYSMQTGSGYPVQNGYNNAANYSPSRNDGGRLASNSNTLTNGFGANYNQYGNNWQDDSRRFAGAQNDNQGLPGTSGYLASNPAPPPPQRPVVPARDTAMGLNPNYHHQAFNQQDNNYFFYVFFILSIAVNLWMVHLLRGLYLKYRNLLTSLRSQSTTVG